MKSFGIYLAALFAGAALATGCYEDKGNYDYREIDELTITGIPEELMSALYKSENLVLSPAVTSKFDGVINADDPNYEFSYYYDRPVGGDFLEQGCWIPVG